MDNEYLSSTDELKSDNIRLADFFQSELQDVFSYSFRTGSLEGMTNAAISRVIAYTENIVGSYVNKEGLSGRRLEDAAFNHFGIISLTSILQFVGDQLIKIKTADRILTEAEHVADIMLPPGEGGFISGNESEYEAPGIIPRSQFIIFTLLERGIEEDDIFVDIGKPPPNGMRNTPYTSIYVESLARLVFVCDEEGNATFVIDTNKARESSIDLDTLPSKHKKELNEMFEQFPGLGKREIYSGDWEERIEQVIFNSLVNEPTQDSRKRVQIDITLGAPMVDQDYSYLDKDEGLLYYTPLGVAMQLRMDPQRIRNFLSVEQLPDDVRKRPLKTHQGVKVMGYSILDVMKYYPESEQTTLNEVEQAGYLSKVTIRDTYKIDFKGMDKWVEKAKALGVYQENWMVEIVNPRSNDVHHNHKYFSKEFMDFIEDYRHPKLPEGYVMLQEYAEQKGANYRRLINKYNAGTLPAYSYNRVTHEISQEAVNRKDLSHLLIARPEEVDQIIELVILDDQDFEKYSSMGLIPANQVLEVNPNLKRHTIGNAIRNGRITPTRTTLGTHFFNREDIMNLTPKIDDELMTLAKAIDLLLKEFPDDDNPRDRKLLSAAVNGLMSASKKGIAESDSPFTYKGKSGLYYLVKLDELKQWYKDIHSKRARRSRKD